jgi:ADP-ribose pyrophosphatase
MIKLVESKKIYAGKCWSVRLDKFRFNDKIIEKEIVEHLPSVGLIPILDNNYILLVSQYRTAARNSVLKFLQGK